MIDAGTDILGVVMVAAGKSAACGNEDGGGNESNLVHFQVSWFCPLGGVLGGRFR